MVVRMMKWLPWPPISSRKFQVNLRIHALEGFLPPARAQSGELEGIMMDVKWKGPKGSFGFRRRSLKRDRTTEKKPGEYGIVSWEEESGCECVLIEAKQDGFQPWDVHFVILQAVQQGGRTKCSVVGTAVMNIANFVSSAEESRQTARINVSGSSGAEAEAALVVTVRFVELRANSDFIQKPSIPCINGPALDVKIAQQLGPGVTDRMVKNAKRPAAAVVDGKLSQELYILDRAKLSSSSEETSHNSGTLFDSDSVEDYDDEEERLEDGNNSSFRKSFSYGTLAGVNLVLEGALPSFREGESPAEHRVSIHSRIVTEAIPKLTEISNSEQAAIQPTMRSLLSWKKRRLSFRSPRARGEPLLNKAYGDDGGDDIDHDRRQSCSTPVEQFPALCWKFENTTTPIVSGCLDFGEEGFSVGCWERKEFISREGHMKLSANVFFASIDQRNEKAAGESACTALVAVIADWLHRNPNRMPIRTEFDTLIREGSAEWRRLCDIEAYRDRFPDGHFDLDTVLQAKVRPLKVTPGRSFVGFFQPEGVGDSCDFLQGAMLFENVWDAIVEETINIKSGDGFEPAIYIVSWNDHFFILKVDREAYYIIDTLGERLYEGCSQAYIVSFDKKARLCHVPKGQIEGEEKAVQPPSGASCGTSSSGTSVFPSVERTVRKQEGRDGSCTDVFKVSEDEVVYEGKEACKQFLKGFFAAVPLRELQIDIKKGLLGKVPLHQRLQIEFHYMSLEDGA